MIAVGDPLQLGPEGQRGRIRIHHLVARPHKQLRRKQVERPVSKEQA